MTFTGLPSVFYTHRSWGNLTPPAIIRHQIKRHFVGTVAYSDIQIRGNEVALNLGISRCHPDDQFSRRQGRGQANEGLTNGVYPLTDYSVANGQVSAFKLKLDNGLVLAFALRRGHWHLDGLGFPTKAKQSMAPRWVYQ